METNGLIYKVQDYKETSKLFYIYSPYGKYTLVARGAKGYKSSYRAYDYLTLISCELNINKSMQTLKKSEIINYYDTLKSDYKKSRYAGLILKAIDLITDDLPHQRVFDMITWLLTFKDIELAAITLYIKLTYALGYELTFHKTYESFDLFKGTTTPYAQSLTKIETMALQTLYYLKEEIELTETLKETLKQFIKKYYIYHMDYDIKL